MRKIFFILILFTSCLQKTEAVTGLIRPDGNTVETRISCPPGFTRTPVKKNSFEYYLRNFQCLPDGSNVFLYNSQIRKNASHAAVLDLSVGKSDLQQCADAVIRLRAEYLYSYGRKNEISFDLTNGFACSFEKWSLGYRIMVSGNSTKWVKSAPASSERKVFDDFLIFVFRYAGTFSLSKQLSPKSIPEIQPGDVFIQGGFPGHAVIVADAAINANGEKIILLAQSYMPAQSVHILKNPEEDISPWYRLDDSDGNLNTPDWYFNYSDLKKF